MIDQDYCNECDQTTEAWFSRAFCPDPCGTMHWHCSECGAVLDECEWEDL